MASTKRGAPKRKRPPTAAAAEAGVTPKPDARDRSKGGEIKPVHAELKTTPPRQRLDPDVAEGLRQLRRRDALGLRTKIILDASEMLGSLNQLLERSQRAGRLSLPGARRILVAIGRWSTKLQPERSGQTSRLTIGSVDQASRLLVRLTHVAWQQTRRTAARKPYKPEDRAFRSFVAATIDTLLGLARSSEDPRAWEAVFDFARRAPVETLGDILDSSLLGERYAALAAEVAAGLEQLLLAGDVDAARGLVDASRRHSELNKSLAGSLVALQQRMAASDLPVVARHWVMRTLGFETAEELTYAASYERPGVRQAAGLLLFLWDLRDSSSQLKEAYERYRRVAEAELKLFVRGEAAIGTVVPFRAERHEFEVVEETEREPSHVQPMRPWIEYSDASEAKVVIRALARVVGP